MEALPAEWATMLRLHALDGHPYEQIAAMMGYAPDTVRARLYRAQARLRAALN